MSRLVRDYFEVVEIIMSRYPKLDKAYNRVEIRTSSSTIREYLLSRVKHHYGFT